MKGVKKSRKGRVEEKFERKFKGTGSEEGQERKCSRRTTFFKDEWVFYFSDRRMRMEKREISKKCHEPNRRQG